MKKQWKHYPPEEKVAILGRHLVEGVPISDLYNERRLEPTVFYRWQKEVFENGAAAFPQRGCSSHQPEQERIAYLEQKVHPGVRPRVISDNGPQFIAKDFKEFIRLSGMTHVRTSPCCLQSHGKIGRWHKSLKGEFIRPGTPLSLEDARRLVEGYVEHYNKVRLNSAMGYITPKDMLAGHQQEIQAARDRKLEAAREQRKNRGHRAA